MKSTVQNTAAFAALAAIAITPSVSAMDMMVNANASTKMSTMSMTEIHNSAANFLAGK